MKRMFLSISFVVSFCIFVCLAASHVSAKTVGALIQETVVCGIENCHGLDIVCGPNPPQMCPMMYQVGDGCRRFAKCEIIGGKCRLKPDARFEDCKNCIAKCLNDTANKFADSVDCERQCLPQYPE